MYRQVGRLRLFSMSFCTLSKDIYGLSSKIGGASADCLYARYAGSFHNNELMEFKKKVYSNQNILPGVTIVTTREECEKCVEILMKADKTTVWDTETMDLDVKQEAPVGNGKIICASFFAGPEFDFGRGPRVFVDNFGQNAGLLDIFKPYLESESHKKAWHNYGFDRHVFYNHEINVRGFGGDTMHMARLLDSSKSFGGYSLAELTKQYADDIGKASNKAVQLQRQALKRQYIRLQAKGKNSDEVKMKLDNLNKYLQFYVAGLQLEKKKMDSVFGRKRTLKSGGEGITYEYPTTLTLHTNKQYIEKWINYSVLDSESTFFLKEVLEVDKLEKQKNEMDKAYQQPNNMLGYYQKYWLPLGQALTQLEREGIRVDLEHMRKIEEQAEKDLKEKRDRFLAFLFKYQGGRNVDHFNPSSPLQLQQLLFAPCEVVPGMSVKQKKQMQKTGKMDNESLRIYEEAKESDAESQESQSYEVKPKGTRKPVVLNELVKTFKVANMYAERPKLVEMEITGLGLPFTLTTPTGLPAVDISVLEELAGNPSKGEYGKAYDHFKNIDQQFGKDLCKALKTLVEHSSNQTLLKTFIKPLQGYVDASGRVHCSLNINTETGRLSAKKPNLQNQPALDKDVYKIRKAFVASEGNKLIVADYGQLELRVLAHLTNCEAMLKAFKEGGDFHSRTAIGMYDYIKKQIDEGTILLEWDRSKGEAPVPLLKEKYTAERKKAKTVNFSIAYGKSAIGFASDWGCTIDEAKLVISSWFRERKEVEVWQKEKKLIAKKTLVTETLMGRKRNLKNFFKKFDPSKKLEGMGNRRAINTPIQGGAADIVNASMVKIAQNARLKQLGWRLLMQIHDELILQGPQESATEALAIVKDNMENPFSFKLRVDLQIDANIGDNWYECK